MRICPGCQKEVEDYRIVCPACRSLLPLQLPEPIISRNELTPWPPPARPRAKKAEEGKPGKLETPQDSSVSTSERISRIGSIRLFVEPPPNWNPNSLIWGLPKGFLELADKALHLDGELVSYVKAHGMPEPETIKRLNDLEMRAFFASQAKAPFWDVYYGSGASSGARYSILVEFRVQPGIRCTTKEARREVVREYQSLFARAGLQYSMQNPGASTGRTMDHAMKSASHDIMVKYGLSMEEMHTIVSEAMRAPDAEIERIAREEMRAIMSEGSDEWNERQQVSENKP